MPDLDRARLRAAMLDAIWRDWASDRRHRGPDGKLIQPPWEDAKAAVEVQEAKWTLAGRLSPSAAWLLYDVYWSNQWWPKKPTESDLQEAAVWLGLLHPDGPD